MKIEIELYFAYGSNLNYRQMRERCPSAEVLSKAKKYNYELCFPLISKKRGNKGVASIKKLRGSVVEGVVYRISKNDFLELDKFEADGLRYQRKKVFVKLKGNIQKLVWTYIANSSHEENFKPGNDYLNLILSGAEQHMLSKNYIKNIKKRGELISPLFK